MATSEKPLRRDAQLNRERILAAAAELFAERGLTVTLDDVAERAGLGVGTVYRRFRSRDELIEALFEERVQELVSLADEAVADPDPWEGLRGFLERIVRLQAADRGLKETLLGTKEGRARVAAIRDQMRGRAEELVRRAKAAGVVRDDFEASDLPLLQMMVGAVAEVAATERPDLWRRQLALLLDGIRADGHRERLPVPPLGFDALETCLMARPGPGHRRG